MLLSGSWRVIKQRLLLLDNSLLRVRLSVSTLSRLAAFRAVHCDKNSLELHKFIHIFKGCLKVQRLFYLPILMKFSFDMLLVAEQDFITSLRFFCNPKLKSVSGHINNFSNGPCFDKVLHVSYHA